MTKPANSAPEITEEQKREWRLRESIRMSDGTYTRLPRSWTDSLWFIYKARDYDHYFEIRNAAWKRNAGVETSDAYLNHYPHVSMNDGAKIAFTENDAKGVADRQTVMKAGKYLTKFFGDVLTAEQIRDMATAFAAEYAPQTLRFAVTADEIEHVYTHGPYSCMSHAAGDYHGHCHPVRVYGDSDLQVAYIAPRPGRITARAIVWPAKKRYGQAYGDAGRLLPLLKEAGYSSGSMVGARVRLIEDENTSDSIIMPYVDGISCGDIDDNWVVLGDGDIEVQSTSGITCNGPACRCEHCGAGMHEDDTYAVAGIDGYYCDSCIETETVICDHTGVRILTDDAVEMHNGVYWSRTAFRRHGFECPINGTNHAKADGVVLADDALWSQAAFDAGGFVCHGTGLNQDRAVLVVMADGALWSQAHFDAYGHVANDGSNVRNTDAPDDVVKYRCPDTLEMPFDPPSQEIGIGSRVRVVGYVEAYDGLTGTVIDGVTLSPMGYLWGTRPSHLTYLAVRCDNGRVLYLRRQELELISPAYLQEAA